MIRSVLPEREVAICRRLKLWREQRGIKRKDFAGVLDIRADSYSSYEYARAPLRYRLARQITAEFPLNPRWLATGDGPSGVRVVLPPAEELGESPRALFSQVYDRWLAADVERDTAAIVGSFNFSLPLSGSRLAPPGPERLKVHQMLAVVLRERLLQVPDEHVSEFVAELLRFMETKVSGYPTEASEVVQTRRTLLELEAHLREQARRQMGIPDAL